MDGIVLFLASSAALFADPRVASVTSNRWLAVGFPLVVVGMMHARRVPDDRFNVSLLDTLANVLGIVSLAAMLTISADAIFGGAAPLALASRLWLFAVVYLGIARAVLVSVRRQAMRSEAFATPTLIVGAGMIGAHLVRRLFGEPRYGLRPVGFLDSDPMPVAPRRAVPSVPGARRSRAAGRRDRRDRRPPRDPGLLARARPRAGRQGPGMPGARRRGSRWFPGCMSRSTSAPRSTTSAVCRC